MLTYLENELDQIHEKVRSGDFEEVESDRADETTLSYGTINSDEAAEWVEELIRQISLEPGGEESQPVALTLNSAQFNILRSCAGYAQDSLAQITSEEWENSLSETDKIEAYGTIDYKAAALMIADICNQLAQASGSAAVAIAQRSS